MLLIPTINDVANSQFRIGFISHLKWSLIAALSALNGINSALGTICDF